MPFVLPSKPLARHLNLVSLDVVALLALACAPDGAVLELFGFNWNRRQALRFPLPDEEVRQPYVHHLMRQMKRRWTDSPGELKAIVLIHLQRILLGMQDLGWLTIMATPCAGWRSCGRLDDIDCFARSGRCDFPQVQLMITHLGSQEIWCLY